MMKKIFRISVILACFVACSALPRDIRQELQGPYKPVTFEPPAPERIELDNGMVVYLLEDHELPLVQVTSFIRTGAIYEPAGMAGLAALTGTVMRTGGTAAMTADEIDRQLEDMSALVTVGIGLEQGTATLSVLREDFDRAFSLYADILQHPAFELDKVEIARNTTCQGLRQVPDNPQNIAFREFKKLLYEGNPRGVQPTLASVRSLRRQDLLQFHKLFFRPENIMLAVSGDFSRGEMLARIKKQFGLWQKAPGAAPVIGAPAPLKSTATYYLQKQIPQSTIIVGQFAPLHSDPDAYAFQVIDFIIGGGGFTSRLFSEVRSNRGLAYSVGSFYRGALDYGVFGAYCMTKAVSTRQALGLMMEIFGKIKKGEISEQELAWAKESLLNNFIFAFTGSAQIITQQMQLEYDRLPADFLRTAPDKIRSLTMADIHRVAEKWLNPDRMLIFVVGDEREFDVRTDKWQWGRVQSVTSDILSENR